MTTSTQATHVYARLNDHGQGYDYETVIRDHGGYTLRVTLHVDTSYANQCRGTVAVLTDALTWTDLVHADRERLASGPRWTVTRRVGGNASSDPVRERMARQFCEVVAADLFGDAVAILPTR